uniref:Serine/threonine-protein phosphatase 4 regulatory subunit 1-like n=1 Tax=Tursiops truncatus TaxID=9739 RepID=A0A6J3Q1V9_TURTR|nr:serine/threonine-protein phosphatase 4 regulatory subunit 1-like [Tursiops truncatus]
MGMLVRKSSQEVLLILLEQDLIFQHDIENKVCPILLALSAPDGEAEYKAEAVSVICKLASVLSKSTVERRLLPRFCELCGDGKSFKFGRFVPQIWVIFVVLSDKKPLRNFCIP